MLSSYGIHRRHIISTLFVLVILTGSSRRFGTGQELLVPTGGKHRDIMITRDYMHITGVLLDGPSYDNRRQRSDIMGRNDTYIRGRIYDITDRTVKSWIKIQSTSMPISLIIEQDKYQQFRDDFGNLQKEFASNKNITLLSDRTLNINNMHAKTFVGEKRWVIQTANLNRSSFYDNREHFFFGTDEMIRKNLLDLYALDTKTIIDKKRYKSDYLTLTKSFSPNLLVCPLDCRQKLEFLIKSAKKSIRISAQYITDKGIIDILRNKSDLDIRILTNNMTSNDNLIRYFGKKVVQFEPSKQYNHDKMIIIDEQHMLIGSMNLSENALDNNREIGIILTDKEFIRQQYKLFK